MFGAILLLLSFELVLADRTPLTVETSRGSVFGFHEDLGDGDLFHGEADVFLSIPYAQPPIGELRFKVPRPICSYGDGINATYYKAQCPQIGSFRDPLEPPLHPSDDCLFINVVSPSVEGNYPVMFWIHGGGLTFGSSEVYDYKGGIQNFVNNGVVLVSINYRLGMTGFFTTYTDDIPPNRGIFDMVLALRWVQEEIANFGGDPTQVTIFGESAGSVSVSVLSLSPLTRGLFQRVLQQSGSTYIAYAVPNKPTGDKSQTRAETICGFTKAQWDAGDFTALHTCLNSKASEEFTQYDSPTLEDLGTGAWAVTLDGAIFPNTPSVLARDRPNYPAFIGNVNNEWAIFMSFDLSQYNSTYLARATASDFGEDTPTISEIIRKTYEYANIDDNDHVGWFTVAEKAMTDMEFMSQSRRDAQWYLNNGNKEVYMYNFNWKEPTPCKTVNVGGVPMAFHAGDNCYLWKFPYYWLNNTISPSLTEGDRQLSDFMGKAWTNFAKSQQPYDGWTPISNGKNFDYYQFDQIPGKLLTDFAGQGNVLYNNVIPTLLGEYPKESVPDDTLKKIQAYGQKTLAEFNHDWCGTGGGGRTTRRTRQTTSTTGGARNDGQSSSTSTSTVTTTTTKMSSGFRLWLPFVLLLFIASQ